MLVARTLFSVDAIFGKRRKTPPSFAENEKLITVTYEEYKNYIKAEASIQVYLKGTVEESRRSYAQSEAFSLSKPSLELSVSKSS